MKLYEKLWMLILREEQRCVLQEPCLGSKTVEFDPKKGIKGISLLNTEKRSGIQLIQYDIKDDILSWELKITSI